MLRRPCLPGAHAPSWALAEGLGSAVLSLASMFAVARIIGPEAVGAGVTALAAFQLLDSFGSTLFTDALLRHPRLEPRHTNGALAGVMLLGFAAAIGLALVSPLLAWVLGMPETMPLLLALVPLLPLSAFSGIVATLALRDQRYRLVALRVLLGQPAALAVAILLAQAGAGAWALIGFQAVLTLSTFLLLLGMRQLPRARFDRAALRELWSVAGPQSAAMLVNTGKYRLFLMVVAGFTTQAVVAQAHFAFRLLDAALNVAWIGMARLSTPRLAAAQADRGRLTETYAELARLHALLGLPLAIGVALVGPTFVRAVLGPAWVETGTATQVAALVVTPFFLTGMAGSLFVVLDRAQLNLRIALAGAALPFLLLLVLQPHTPAGLALVWSSPGFVLPLLNAWLVRRALGRPHFWLLPRVIPGLLATVAMAMAVLAVQRWGGLRPLAEFLVTVPLGALVFAATAWLALGRRMPAAILDKEPLIAGAAAE